MHISGWHNSYGSLSLMQYRPTIQVLFIPQTYFSPKTTVDSKFYDFTNF